MSKIVLRTRFTCPSCGEVYLSQRSADRCSTDLTFERGCWHSQCNAGSACDHEVVGLPCPSSCRNSARFEDLTQDPRAFCR